MLIYLLVLSSTIQGQCCPSKTKTGDEKQEKNTPTDEQQFF
jgi:hypothetical protein